MATTYGYNPNWTTRLGGLAGQPSTLEQALASIPGLGSGLAYRAYLDNMEQQKQARAQLAQFQQERGMLGPESTPEDFAKLGARYAGPKELLQYGQTSADRQAQIAATREMAKGRLQQAYNALGMRMDALEQNRIIARERLQDQRDKAASDAYFKAQQQAMQERQNEISNRLKEMGLEIQRERLKNNPAAIKEKEKTEGKRQLSSLLTSLYEDYKQLEKLGSDIDPSKSPIENLQNRIASSGPGQLVAGTVGTKSQEVRDRIEAKRAGLLSAMKQATGMGATQLNSNVELQFYMKMATSTTAARWANRAALAHLDKTYGLGLGVTADPRDIAKLKTLVPGYGAKSFELPAGISQAEWDAMTPEDRALWQK